MLSGQNKVLDYRGSQHEKIILETRSLAVDTVKNRSAGSILKGQHQLLQKLSTESKRWMKRD